MQPIHRRTLGAIADVLFPGRCVGCGDWLLFEDDARLPMCGNCLALLPSIPEPRCNRCGIELVSEKATCLRCRSMEYRFHFHRSLFPYQGMAKCLLQALKFEGRGRVAGFFAARCAYELKKHFRIDDTGAVVIPVPPRPGRKGPDAVEMAARRLLANHAVPVWCLLRRTSGVQQKTLGFEQRRANLRGAIEVVPGQDARAPRRVVLLDDVFTTGATVDACAQALLQAGCEQVDALTLVMEE